MTIQVRLFAILRDTAGVDGFALELPDASTVAAARDAIVSRYPALSDHLKRSAFAVNREYAHADAVLSNGDELALIPPVSGG